MPFGVRKSSAFPTDLKKYYERLRREFGGGAARKYRNVGVAAELLHTPNGIAGTEHGVMTVPSVLHSAP